MAYGPVPTINNPEFGSTSSTINQKIDIPNNNINSQEYDYGLVPSNTNYDSYGFVDDTNSFNEIKVKKPPPRKNAEVRISTNIEQSDPQDAYGVIPNIDPSYGVSNDAPEISNLQVTPEKTNKKKNKKNKNKNKQQSVNKAVYGVIDANNEEIVSSPTLKKPQTEKPIKVDERNKPYNYKPVYGEVVI